MRKLRPFLGSALLFAAAILHLSAQDQPIPNFASKAAAARKVFLDDQLKVPNVVGKTRAQLLKWGRFELVQSACRADLILVLSADPYRGGNIVISGGETGDVDNGHVTVDRWPNYNKLSPTRYAYLTVIDPQSHQMLWETSHAWGGLLTGFDSVGARLVKKLEKELN
jgi:hypothetical protein